MTTTGNNRFTPPPPPLPPPSFSFSSFSSSFSSCLLIHTRPTDRLLYSPPPSSLLSWLSWPLWRAVLWFSWELARLLLLLPRALGFWIHLSLTPSAGARTS